MPYIDFTDEEKARAKQWDLVSYLQTYEPDELIRRGNEYITRTHDSLVISKNGKWHWCSQGFGGKTALSYLIDVKGMDYQSAMLHLLGEHVQLTGQTSLPPPKQTATAPKEKKPFALPTPYGNCKRVFAYLHQTRCIEPEIILACMRDGTIYESKEHHNCVFVGRDEQGKARFASQRGTYGDFKNDIESSEKAYGFFLPAAEQPCPSLAVFESPIDALSHATLQYMKAPNDWSNINRLSSSGTNEIPIRQFLLTHPETKDILLCYDNDVAGLIRRMPRIKENLEKDFPGLKITIDPPPQEKDYNAYLKSIAPQKRRDFDLERG